MRITALILGLSLFIALPAMANEQHIFSSTNCRNKIACPGTGPLTSAATWAEIGNTCLSESISMKTEGGYFDEMAGLDNEGCLPVRYSLLATKNEKTLLPHCCVVPIGSTCIIHCDITNGW